MDKKVEQRAGISSEALTENFQDIHPAFDDFQAMNAASACIYCFDAPCVRACPTSIDIPTFIRKISTGNLRGSAHTILSANILGGTCARACPTEVLCEEACVRNQAEGEPVEIGRLQRYAVDPVIDLPADEHPFERAPSTGKRVAVIGAGPAGLSCAHRLALLGHEVDIFEAMPKPGGLNEYGLAAYKMTEDFAQREVEFVLGVGNIEISYGRALGDGLPLSALKKSHNAVFIGVGLRTSNDLFLEESGLHGIQDALSFIERLRQSPEELAAELPDKILVIGGGNTAIDAAVQAKKLGAADVTLCYRRGEDDMTATKWEQELALKNGVTINHWSLPKAAVGKHEVEAITFERSFMDEHGKLGTTGEKFDIEAELVLTAVGQRLDSSALGEIEISAGKVSVDANYQTTDPGVFAGGDCIAMGEDLTVQAVEDGKQAALAIDRYLSE
jgi:dihydropyrimidine dehydrogenase (NAD+) subunit PreT